MRRCFWPASVQRSNNPEVVEQSDYTADDQDEDQRPYACGSPGGHHVKLCQESGSYRNPGERQHHKCKDTCQHRSAPEQASVVFQRICVSFFIGENRDYSKCADCSYEV